MSVAHWEPLLIFVAVMVPSLRGFLFVAKIRQVSLL